MTSSAKEALLDLTGAERFLLEWLSKEDWSSYGECRGKSFDKLLDAGLVEKRPSNRSHIDESYDLCRLTDKGIAALRAQSEAGQP